MEEFVSKSLPIIVISPSYIKDRPSNIIPSCPSAWLQYIIGICVSLNLFSTNLILPHYKIRFFTRVNNLFNVKYRDYLNRQRYFANDLGLSVIIGLNFKF